MCISARYSSFCMAPDMQPAYISAVPFSFSGSSPISTTSDMLKWPPGFSTLNISFSTLFLLGTRFSTQLLTTTSATLAVTGIFSMSPYLNSTLLKPSFSAFSLALFIIASVKSMPITLPVSPVAARATKQSLPAPLPRSITVLPGSICANCVGKPQPKPRSASAL